MATHQPLHIRFNEAFEKQSLGHAILHPCSTTELHPGVCGYFDDDGDWKTIIDIPRLADDIKKMPPDLKFTTADNIPPLSRPIYVEWDPKCSSDVSFTKVGEDASALITSGFKASGGFKFQKENEFGAVIFAQDAVRIDSYPEDTCFYRWLEDNFGTIVDRYPELFESSMYLWIITKTYSTPKCSIACWSGTQKTTSLQFGAKIPAGAAELSPDASNSAVVTSGPGWEHYGVTVAHAFDANSAPSDTTQTEYVLFAAGLRFTAKRTVLGQLTKNIHYVRGSSMVLTNNPQHAQAAPTKDIPPKDATSDHKSK